MMSTEQFPNTAEAKLWYDTNLFHNWSDYTSPLSYNSHRDGIKKCFEKLGMNFSAVTHIGRKSASNMADCLGAPVESIRRAGRWNTETVTNVYMSALPKDTMRLLAGFTADGNSYYLSRASIDPPPELLQRIFPKIEALLEQQQSKANESNMAAMGFLRLMSALRKVILQDSVLLKRDFPGSIILSHPIFQTKVYLDFEARLLFEMEVQETGADHRLKDVNSILAENLSNINTNLSRINSCLTQKIDDVSKNQQRIEYKFDNILSAKQLKISVKAAWEDDCFDEEAVDESFSSSMQSKTEKDTSAKSILDSSKMIYQMNRSIKTIPDAFEEWCKGICGFPSIERLDKQYGCSWRSGQAEKQFYLRRKRLITLINSIANKKQTNSPAVVALMEQKRVQEKRSLDWIQKNIGTFAAEF
jgi:hypothetical protein